MERKYTFVVGAGGSFELGFPVGAGLTKDISSLLTISTDDFGDVKSGNKVILGALSLIPSPSPPATWNKSYLYRASNDIAVNMGLALSIDNYLEAKKDVSGYSEIGKIAIAKAILDKERSSELWFDWRRSRRLDFSRLPNNWLSNFFQILTSRKGLDGYLAALSSFRFVTFNYDRAIEHFFFHATKSYFGLTDEEAERALGEALNVVHVYGSIGQLRGVGAIEFGSGEDSRTVFAASRNIRTFTEGVEDEDQLGVAKQWCKESDAIIFLGFAFLALNLKALAPEEAISPQRIFGTVLGVSDDNIEIAKKLLTAKWLGKSSIFFDFRKLECQKLVSDISGYLAEDDLDAAEE